MARRTNQRLKTLILRQILLEKSDEAHPLTTQELVDQLALWGIRAERKSLYGDLESLKLLPMDIQNRRGKEGGWFIGQRSFQLAELKLLVDAVQSCKFITKGKSDALIRKLEALTSVHQARQLQRQVYVDRRVKTHNERVYYTIDQLHTAISAKKGVSFHYFEYNIKKEQVFRRGGKLYYVLPYGLIWDNENYYMVGWDNSKGSVRHYRVDKMADLEVVTFPLRGEGASFDMARYTAKHFGMFSGQEGQVRLRCDKGLVGVVLDRFGQETMLVPDGDQHFTVTLEAVVSPQFFGWLFGLGAGVQLLAPSWAVEAYNARLQEAQRGI